MNWFTQNKRKAITIGLLLTVVCGIALAAGFERIPQPLIKMGRGLAEAISIEFENNAGETLTVDNTGDAAFTTDDLKLGDGTASDKRVTFDRDGVEDPYIGWDNASQKFGFSKDGTKFSQFGTGSGSGSGINLLNPDNNPGFEDGTDTWVASTPAQLTIETVNPIFELQSGIWDPAALNDTLETADLDVPIELKGRSCSAAFTYLWDAGTTGEITALVQTAGGDDLTLPVDVEQTIGVTRQVFLAFICPTGSEQIKITLTATTNAQPITLDSFHLGSNIKEGVVDAKITSWQSFTPGINNFGTVTNVNFQWRRVGESIEVRGDFVSGVSVASVASIVLPNSYTIDFVSGAGAGIEYQIVGHGYRDGASNTIFQVVALQGEGFVRIARFNRSADENPLGSTNGNSLLNNGERASFQFKVPIAQFKGQGTTETVTLETQGWYVSGNIGTGGFVTLGTSNVTSYDRMDAPGADLQLASGSQAAQITCQGAPAEGLTCSGTETIGINFQAPYAGLYRTCFSATHVIRVDGVEEVQTGFVIVKKSNSNNTILEQGRTTVISSLVLNNVSADRLTRTPIYICDEFQLSAGENSFALYREQTISGTILANGLDADRGSSTVGDQNINITVFPLTQQFPQAVAINNVESEAVNDCKAGNICSGTYVPTITNVSNANTITEGQANWTRVGNIVTVYGKVVVNTPASVLMIVDITLPILTDITLGDQLSGVSAVVRTTSNMSYGGYIEGEPSPNTARLYQQIVTGVVSNHNITYSFSYELQ